MVAAESSHLSVIEYLIKCGVDVDCFCDNGQTILHFACRRGWLQVVKSAVSKGCNLNAKDFIGRTPLMVAVDNAHSSVVEYLIECGAGEECCDEDNWLLLKYACKTACLEMVKYLVSKGCDLNVKFEWGRTPLLIAAEYSDKSIVTYLI